MQKISNREETKDIVSVAKNGHLTFGERLDRFELKHPDIAGYVTEMLGAYIACQKKSPDSLDEMYSHTAEQCDWCKVEFAARRRFTDRFIPERRTA